MITQLPTEGEIDLTQDEGVEGVIDLSDQNMAPPISDPRDLEAATNRTDYALGGTSPGRDEVFLGLSMNQQERFQNLAAVNESMRLREEFRDEARSVLEGAIAEGRGLTEEEADYISVLQGKLPVPPKVALEKSFGNRVTAETLPELDDFPAPVAHQAHDEVSDHIAKQQVAHKILMETKQKYDESSWLSWGADALKLAIPGYNMWKMNDKLEGSITDSIWTGSNIEQQMRSLYLMPLDQFEERLRQAVDELGRDNIIQAASFANAAVSFSSYDAALENLFLGLDILDVAPVAGVIVSGVAGIGVSAGRAALRNKVKSVTEELANPDLSHTDLAVLKGKGLEGAEAKVVAEMSAMDMTPGLRPERVTAELSKSTFGLADDEAFLRGAGSLTNEAQRRIRDSLERNKNILMKDLMPGESGHVVRMSPEAIDEGLKLARREQARLYPHLEDHIIEITPVRESELAFGGVDYIAVDYGDKFGTPFQGRLQAEIYAEKWLKVSPEQFVPYQKGDSWVLRVERSVDETNPNLADLRLKTGYETPDTWVNGWLQAIRMGDATRGTKASEWAKVATFGSQSTAERMAEVTKTIGKMGKNEANRLGEILQDAQFKHRTVVDPVTGEQATVQGVFYKSQLELEQAYLAKGYNLPSPNESLAYWTFRQLMDYDLLQRNIGMWRDKARQGMTQHEIGWVHKGKDGTERIKLPPVEGRVVENLPSNADGVFTVGWSDIKGGSSGFALSSQQNWYKKVQELLSQDYKIVQVFDKNNKQLKDAVKSKSEPVDYLIVRDWKEKPLSFHQVPASEGGHWIYPQTGGYVKQPRVHNTGFGRRIYDGDMTVHWQGRGADAKALSKAYETARRMVLTNDPGLDQFAIRNLPYTGPQLRAKFEDGTFNKDIPFVYTEHGQQTKDVLKMDGLVDPSDTGLSGRVSTGFTQQRGDRLTSVEVDKSQNNPAFKLYGAPALDPMRAMTRGLSELSRSRYFEDYVHQASENYIQQFGNVFDVSDAQLRADPMRFIREPKYLEGADPKVVAAAKNARRNLLYLLGQDSYDMGLIKTFKQKTIDSVLEPYGKSGRLLDRHQWDASADPAVIGRSAVFDMYLGLFNPLQLPLQGQGVTLVAAIDGSPVRAAQANLLYWTLRMRGMSSTNPGAQGMFGKAAQRALGLPRHVVDEAYDVFMGTGMNVFGGAYNRLDDFLSPSMFDTGKGPMRRFLDGGRFFFKEGNMMHQGTAFMTSYLRWKQAPGNELKKPTQRDLASIVDRASLYYNEMTRASSSALLSNSAFSIPTQFSSFHRNLSELLLGERLTVPEKARVMMMYSLMYGAPVGNPVSMATAPIWPMSESIRQSLLEEGVDTDSSFLLNTFYNGIGQAFISELSGTNYDTERYAPAGLPWLKELVNNNFLEIIQGPSGTGLGRALETAAPFYHGLMSVFTNNDEGYSITSQDVVDVARNISSLNMAARAYYAVTAGRIETKDGALQSRIDAGPLDAALIGVLGLTPQEVTDAYLMIDSQKKEDEAKAEIVKEALVQFRRSIKASKVGNHEEAYTFAKNAKALLRGAGLNEMEMANAFRRGWSENETLIEQVSPDFTLRDPSKRLPRFQQQMDQKYNQ